MEEHRTTRFNITADELRAALKAHFPHSIAMQAITGNFSVECLGTPGAIRITAIHNVSTSRALAVVA